ncbi:alanine racemase [Paracoccus suum]|uniref:Alanine racemase n=1 Tax=Paracoccus suum TaxID=2259340 RepID=A0A344PPJ6_9RHOB|nr:alanine racemase [Paracoccus suum]AXC51301.1 alanine racemase [Paracoccus suum]
MTDPGTFTHFLRPEAAGLPTPHVEIDEQGLMRNLGHMQARAEAAGLALRPHIKTHKCLAIARRQLDLGAVGVTASKPAEALVFVEAGVPSLTLAYPVVRPESITELVRAATLRGTELRLIVAHQAGVEAIGNAAAAQGVRLPVFLKVDVGLGRVGVKPQDEAAIRLAAEVDRRPHLTFLGLLSHAGHSYGSKSLAELASIAEAEAAALCELAGRLRQAGIEVPEISVGATPTCLGAPIPRGVTEIRPGNYAFLDRTALRLDICAPDDLALAVIATVVAHNDKHFIVDAGSKSLSSDLGAHGSGGSGFGLAVSMDGTGRAWEVERLSEEHGFVRFSDTAPDIGSRVRIFPNHSCAVMAQFDSVNLRQADGRTVVLRVDARGRQT